MIISDTGWTPTQTQKTPDKSAQMDQQDFLKLLVTQISQQDPLNPTDSTQFMAQLAQFSSLEQMINMNSKLEALTLSNSAATSTAVASLIGKNVTATGNQIELQQEGPVTLSFTFPSQAQDVEIEITDDAGKIVRTIELGEHAAGPGYYEWDGLDQQGNRLTQGHYRFAVRGTDEQGEQITATGRINGTVDGISYDQGYPQLLIGDRRITLGEVIEISEHS